MSIKPFALSLAGHMPSDVNNVQQQRACNKRKLEYLDLASEVETTFPNPGKHFSAQKKIVNLIGISGCLLGNDTSVKTSIFAKQLRDLDRVFCRSNFIRRDTAYSLDMKIDEQIKRLYVMRRYNGWRQYEPFQGKHHFVLKSSTDVIKIGKNEERYKREQAHLHDIYSLIGNVNEGIQKRGKVNPKRTPLHICQPLTGQRRSFVNYHVEDPYPCTLYDLLTRCAVLETDMEPIMYSLARGSQTLIRNNIYHLDTKAENIGYTRTGRAEHFDFGGSCRIRQDGGLSRGLLNGYIPSEDLKKIKSYSKEERIDRSKELPSFLEAVHVFQLGSVFYNVFVGEMPYADRDGEWYSSQKLKENLSRTSASRNQIDMITAMLSMEVEERPKIDEVVSILERDDEIPR